MENSLSKEAKEEAEKLEVSSCLVTEAQQKIATALAINDITGMRMAIEILKSAVHVAKDACTIKEQTDSMRLQIITRKTYSLHDFLKRNKLCSCFW